MTTNRAIDEVDDFRQGPSAMSQTRITKFIRIFDVTNPVDRARLDMERGRRNLEDALRVAEDQESQRKQREIVLAAHAERVNKRSKRLLEADHRSESSCGDDSSSAGSDDEDLDPIDNMRRRIDNFVLNIDNTAGDSSRMGTYGKKPDNWVEILDFYRDNGFLETLQRYRNCFPSLSTEGIRAKLKRWNNLKPLKANSTRAPSYGWEVDNALKNSVMERLARGLPIDDANLRLLLLAELASRNMFHQLVREHGGKYEFGHSWATRFFKRHKLVVRKVTYLKLQLSDLILNNLRLPQKCESFQLILNS